MIRIYKDIANIYSMINHYKDYLILDMIEFFLNYYYNEFQKKKIFRIDVLKK